MNVDWTAAVFALDSPNSSKKYGKSVPRQCMMLTIAIMTMITDAYSIFSWNGLCLKTVSYCDAYLK